MPNQTLGELFTAVIDEKISINQDIEDAGKVMMVGNDGIVAPAVILPQVSSSDNGKVLRVVNGTWSAATIPNASGVSF